LIDDGGEEWEREGEVEFGNDGEAEVLIKTWAGECVRPTPAVASGKPPALSR